MEPIRERVRCCRIDQKKLDVIQEYTGIFFCEVLGTTVFVFLGCLGSVEGIGNEDVEIHVAISFGLAAAVATQIFYRGSGGHLNPTVTLASLFFRHIKIYMVPLYFIGQCLGALIGYGLIKLLLPHEYLNAGSYEESGLCTTVPNPKLNLFVIASLEFVFTTIFILVVCSLWDIRNSSANISNWKYSFTKFILVFVGNKFTGCSMNPARSLAPAIWNNYWNYHWVYWLVPSVSGIVTGFFYTLFFGPRAYSKNSDRLQAGGTE